MDFTRATEVTPEVEKTIADVFEYHPWAEDQTARGLKARVALQVACEAVIANVPPSPDRSAAIRKIREAWMDANSAITHGGKY